MVVLVNTTRRGALLSSWAGRRDTTAPTISAVSADPSDTGAVVTWTTNEASNSQVEYGTTTSYGSTTTLDTLRVTSHSATIAGLTGDTIYHYRVLSIDSHGNTATGSDNVFTTDANLSSILGAKLVAWYDVGKETAVTHGTGVQVPTDWDGNSYDLRQNSAGSRPTYNTGQFGTAAGWDFTSAGLFWTGTIANTAALGFTGDFAVILLLKSTSATSQGVIYRMEADSTDGWAVSIGQGAGASLGKLCVLTSDATAGTWQKSTITTITDGDPHLCIINVVSTTATFYIDGVTHDAVTVKVPTSAATNAFGIGRFPGGTLPFIGQMAVAAICNDDLTAAELDAVAALYA